MKKLFCIIIVLSIVVCAAAEENESFRKKEIKFIKELHAKGRYFDCIAETAKLQFKDKSPVTEYFVYSNYYLAGQYSTVINNYSADQASGKMIFPSLLLLSESYLKKDMYNESYQVLKNYEYSALADKYIFTMFLHRVEPLVLSGETVKIDEEIAGSGIFLKDNYNFVKLRAELLQYKDEGLKSPGCAAALSAVLPGLGQVYAGYPAEGLISLLSVAATAAGGFYMKDSGRTGLSYTLFFFSGLFYGGNIYGAYNSAQVGNNEMLHNRHQRIITQYGSYNPDDYIDIESVFN